MVAIVPIITFIPLVFLFALIGGAIGKAKDRTALGVVLGFLLGLLGVIIVAVIPNRNKVRNARQCPKCCAPIAKGAWVCRTCGAQASDQGTVRSQMSDQVRDDPWDTIRDRVRQRLADE